MLRLYTWTTPNGRKPLILLEELGVPYATEPVNLGKEAQHAPQYRAINPNGKIPALVDEDAGVTVWESGAILLYLAEKHGRFLPAGGPERAAVLTWLMFQMGGVGPFFGQASHFRRRKDPDPYAVERYVGETRRLYGVLEARLAEVEHLAGDYSIADMATYPWAHDPAHFGVSPDDFPHVMAWVDRVGARPAVARAMKLSVSRPAVHGPAAG